MAQQTFAAYGGRPPNNHQETSIDAALRAVDFKDSMQNQVLALLKAYPGGLCDFEIEAALRAKHTTVSARRRELVLEGMVLDSGERRQTPSGCAAIVWRARREDEQLYLESPEQIEVLKSKLKTMVGKLETREQLDEVWSTTKRVLGES